MDKAKIDLGRMLFFEPRISASDITTPRPADPKLFLQAMTLASRIVVMKGGVVQQIGTPEEIYDRPANTFVADFMASPPMNLIPARAVGRDVTIGDWRISTDRDALPSEVILGLRPEQLSPAQGLTPDHEVIPTLIENTGAETYLCFVLGGVTVTARCRGGWPKTPSPRCPSASISGRFAGLTPNQTCWNGREWPDSDRLTPDDR